MVKVLKTKRKGVTYELPHKGGEITFFGEQQIFFDDADADYLLKTYPNELEIVDEKDWDEIYKKKYEEYKNLRLNEVKEKFGDVIKDVKKK